MKIKALAAGWPSWVPQLLLALALGGAWSCAAVAQGPQEKPKAGESKSKAQSKDATKGDAPAPPAEDTTKGTGPATIEADPEQQKAAAVDPKARAKAAPSEVWEDPNAAAVLKPSFKELFPGARSPLSNSEINAIRAMAQAPGSFDVARVQRYLQANANQLTREQNIAAMLAPDGNSADVKKIEDATKLLSEPLLLANDAKNTSFRTSYTQQLIPIARDLLKNHYFARIAAMVVLSRSGDRQAIPVFIEVLNDPKQIVAAKERAAVGLILATQGGRIDLDPGSESIPAARALAEFLEKQPDAFWPVRARLFEALGSLRQASPDPLRGQADFATTALRALADPKAKPDVRAWAGWALGWMRVNDLNPKYNFGLVGWHAGQAAADIGQTIAEVDATNPGRARHLTDLLLQLLVGFNGDPVVLNAGLLKSKHQNLPPSRDLLTGVEQRTRALAQAALDLAKLPIERVKEEPPADEKAKGAAKKKARPRSPRSLARDLVAKRAEELRSYLAKTPPPDWSLVPGGPRFPGPQPQVAAGEKPTKPTTTP